MDRVAVAKQLVSLAKQLDAGIKDLDTLESLADSIKRKGEFVKNDAERALKTGNFGRIEDILEGAVSDFKDYLDQWRKVADQEYKDR